MNHVDSTGVETLHDLTAELSREDVGLVVARMPSYVQKDLSGTGVSEEIGDDRFFPTVRSAVAYCLKRQDRDDNDHPPA